MTDLRLYAKIRSLPDSVRSEVVDFIDFLSTRRRKSKTKVKKDRVFGYAKGKIVLKPDFDAPISDFNDYM